ncbi:MAG TPA: hypothetical protein PK611_07270, partial [Saprospiraceae bacterium]|nr:hypothetical protein [Saprospiraceae bacterium]
ILSPFPVVTYSFGMLTQAMLLLFSLPNKKSMSKKAIAGYRSLHSKNAFSISCSAILLRSLLFLR